MRAELQRRIGEDLWSRLEIECEQVGASVSAPLDGALYPILEQVLRDHDSGAVPLPFLAPFATDAKHLARLGVPTYGFSPLKTGRDDGLLQLMHGDDERVSVDRKSRSTSSGRRPENAVNDWSSMNWSIRIWRTAGSRTTPMPSGHSSR